MPIDPETHEYLKGEWRTHKGKRSGHVYVEGSDGDSLFTCDFYSAAHSLTPEVVAEYLLGQHGAAKRLAAREPEMTDSVAIELDKRREVEAELRYYKESSQAWLKMGREGSFFCAWCGFPSANRDEARGHTVACESHPAVVECSIWRQAVLDKCAELEGVLNGQALAKDRLIARERDIERAVKHLKRLDDEVPSRYDPGNDLRAAIEALEKPGVTSG